MDNPQLETFLRAADAGSFNKAAEQAYITPTAVIKQINLLEGTLGVALFDRTHRGLRLTKAGESLYQDAKYVIQYCKESVIRAKNAMQETSDILRIGSSPMTPTQNLVKLWPKIHEHCPEIKFQLIPFENTAENAREILANLGQNIDVVAGIFDDTLLNIRSCAGFPTSVKPLCCAVAIHHPLASKTRLTVQDLYGENLMLMHRGWSHYVDRLRDDLTEYHPDIHIQDFDLYSVEVFNQCESSSDVLLVVEDWETVHPLLRFIPVEWDYSIPFGLLHSPSPSKTVKRVLDAIRMAMQEDGNES